MEFSDRETLGRFARDRHVHYEVAPEEVQARGGPEATGFEVRLFATRGEDRLGTPASEKSVELLGELRSFAERLLMGEDAGRSEVAETVAPALYQSTEVQDADEVAVTVRVRCGSPDHARTAADDPCIGEIRRRLEAVGVPRR